MSYIIEDNNFTKDSRGVRATRLYFLSNSIDTYAVELEVTGALLTWAQNTVGAFDAAQNRQSAELGEKDAAFQTSQEADAELLERYQILKELLQARYGDDEDDLKIYGIKGPTPRTRDDVIDKAEALIEGNNRQSIAGDPKALPAAMTNNLQTLITDAKDKYYDAGIERREARESTEDINDLYDADSIKLRTLYHWVIAFWGKKEARLIDLGFVPAKEHGGGHTPDAPQNLAYDMGLGQFSWDAVDGATSYQLAYRETGSDDEWQVAYSDSDTSVIFDPGNGEWEFRVRARNEHGYGDWSILIAVSIGLQPPQIWELVYNPSTNKVTLQWHASIGADYHDVYQSVVPLGQPAGAFTMIESVAGQVYQHDVSTYDVREYYYVIARNASGSSDPSEIVFVDVAAT